MWKQKIVSFANRFQHPAWGPSHYERVYKMALLLGRQQSESIDEEALFAAAYLHDMGAFEPYKQTGVDHAERSVQVVEPVLISSGFPAGKVPLVKEIISGHMFYAQPANSLEAIIFHDADTLDFMGIIGVTRLLSIVGLDDWTPDLKSAIALIEHFSKDLADKLITPEAKSIGKARQAEMVAYLDALSQETSNFRVL